MSEAKPTPGPWYADKHGRIWRRPPSDLYENGGGVAGDKPLATVNKGWFGEGEEGYPVDANARLIAEAGTVFHETGLSPRQLAERNAELLEVLRSIDTRLRICLKGPISAAEAYDSFYQEFVAEALAKCQPKEATP